MTKAYIEGFCKAAAAYGVDPVQLMKFAQANIAATEADVLRAAKKEPRGPMGVTTGISPQLSAKLHNLQRLTGRKIKGWDSTKGIIYQ